MEAPKRATKFAANDEWGKAYRNLFGVSKMNQSLSILTGASAGATESFVVVPFELVKIRLQGMPQSAQVFHRQTLMLEQTALRPPSTTACSTASARSFARKVS